jgi:hypothetical protein
MNEFLGAAMNAAQQMFTKHARNKPRRRKVGLRRRVVDRTEGGL